MAGNNQDRPIFDRELNLQKVQILMGYCQTKINAMYAYLIAFIVGFAIFIGTLFYEGHFNVFRYILIDPLLQQISSISLFAIILYLLMVSVKSRFRDINADNDRCLQLVDELYILIDKGYPLPTLSALKQKAFPQRAITRLIKGTKTKDRLTTQILSVDQSGPNKLKPEVKTGPMPRSSLNNKDMLFIAIPSVLGIISFIVSFYSFTGLFEKIGSIQTVNPDVINGLLTISGILFAFQAFIIKKPQRLVRRFVFAIIFTIELLTLSYIVIDYISDVTLSIFPSISTFFFVSFSLIFTLANTGFFIVYDLFYNQDLSES